MKETPKEIENNINIENNNINNNNNNINNTIKKHSSKSSIQKNSSESLKYYQKSENNLGHNNNNKIEEDNKENKMYTKSSTFNKKEHKISNNTIKLSDNSINNINPIQKSRTCRENENIHRASFTLRLNNLAQNHLETVLEKVSEVSNSKVDSSEISDEDENNNNNKDTGKNEIIENKKIKEDFGNSNNTEQRMQGTDSRINDSEYNAANKKSLYFLSSEKTH